MLLLLQLLDPPRRREPPPPIDPDRYTPEVGRQAAGRRVYVDTVIFRVVMLVL